MSGEGVVLNFDTTMFYEKRVRDYIEAQRVNGLSHLSSFFSPSYTLLHSLPVLFILGISAHTQGALPRRLPTWASPTRAWAAAAGPWAGRRWLRSWRRGC